MEVGNTNRFQGVFNGEDNEIRNIYQNLNNGSSTALFREANNATIQNLTLTGKIINSKWHAAGICAGGNVNIINCKNYVDVTGYDGVGGIVCTPGDNSIVNNCMNFGTITITGNSYQYGGAGGIVGYIYAKEVKIENCQNNGNVMGNTTRAGIVGCVTGIGNNIEINNCNNQGKNRTGIVEWVRGGKINIVNTCNLGECDNGIVNRFNGADWDAELELNIQNSYNIGKVSNAGLLGTLGTVSKSITLNIENCYNAGESDKAIVGTISRDSRTETVINITNTYYDGTKSLNIGAISEGITEMNIQNNASLIEILNNNIGSNITWKKWKLEEDGYPVFEQ